MHTDFRNIKVHTAKCDTCNHHNTSTMKQCVDCGVNFCDPCWVDRGSDGTHVLNSGDIGYAATNARAIAKATRPRSLDLLKPKKDKARIMKIPSPGLGGRSKRTRRRTVVIEESESEDDGLNNDEMVLDGDDDEKQEQVPRAPQKSSAVRRGKQREARRPEVPVNASCAKTISTSHDASTSAVKYIDLDTILEEADADAASSLLELASGSYGVPSNSFTPVNTGNTHNTLPRINFTAYENEPRCKTIYSPTTPAFNNQNLSTPLPMDQRNLSDAWYNVPANGTDLPVSMQLHPYPVDPHVTSKVIGHDSQGNYPQQAVASRTNATASNTAETTTVQDQIPHLNTFDQGNIQEQSLFIDPTEPLSDGEITAMSALLTDDPAWPSTASSVMSDMEWQAWLSKEFPKDLNNALIKMEPGMDERGARLFGNDAYGEVWHDEIFNEQYFDQAQDAFSEGRAVAKANLDFEARSRARSARAEHHEEVSGEASEEGEIMDED